VNSLAQDRWLQHVWDQIRNEARGLHSTMPAIGGRRAEKLVKFVLRRRAPHLAPPHRCCATMTKPSNVAVRGTSAVCHFAAAEE
jgi:hypothetical protein